MQNLQLLHANSELQYVGSSSLTRDLNPGPLHWKHSVLATREVPKPQTFKKNLFIYFNWRLITSQYCGGFCHTLTWIIHRGTCVPHPTPLGCPSVPALSALFHALNLDWSSISHMVIYMFQCYFSQIIPPSPSPTEAQKAVLYIWVSFTVSRIGSSLLSS